MSLHLNRQRQSRWAEPSSSACSATKPGWSHVPFVPLQPHVGWLWVHAWPLLVGLGPLKGWSISLSQREGGFGKWGLLTEASDALPGPERKSKPFGNGNLLVCFFCLVSWYSELHLGCRGGDLRGAVLHRHHNPTDAWHVWVFTHLTWKLLRWLVF